MTGSPLPEPVMIWTALAVVVAGLLAVAAALWQEARRDPPVWWP